MRCHRSKSKALSLILCRSPACTLVSCCRSTTCFLYIIGPYLRYLQDQIATNSVGEPFRQVFVKPSGSFRNAGNQTTQTSFRQRFRKASGTFRNSSEMQNNKTSFRQRFRKPSGTFRNSGKNGFSLFERTSMTQLTENNKDNVTYFLGKGVSDGNHIYIYIRGECVILSQPR